MNDGINGRLVQIGGNTVYYDGDRISQIGGVGNRVPANVCRNLLAAFCLLNPCPSCFLLL